MALIRTFIAIKIPEDISIIGFDDIVWSRLVDPSLTTIYVDKREMGYIAVRQVIIRIKMPKTKSMKMVVDTKLLLRNSTINTGKY